MTTPHPRSSLLLVAALTATLVATLALHPRPARAQSEELTIAVFAPTVRFADSVARARYATELAEALSAETGLTVRGVSVSGPSDLEGAHLAIIDGTYRSGGSEGEAILSGRVDGETTAPLALVVRGDGPARLSELRGGTLILPRSGELIEALVGSEVLHGEQHPSEFFGAVERTANIESALSAVAGGRADATVAFARDAEGAGLRVLQTLSAAPFPVVVVLDGDLDGATVDRLREALTSVRASGEPSRFGSFDSDALERFQRAARRAPPEPSPQMAPPRDVDFDPGALALDPDVAEPLPGPRRDGAIAVPPMDPGAPVSAE